MKTKDSKIVIRPGKKYLISIFLCIYITLMMIWVLCKVGPSEILETKGAGVLPMLLLSSSLGIYFGYERLFYELDKRNILRKDDFYVAAKVALEIDKRRRQD